MASSIRQKRVILLATGAAVVVALIVLYLLGNVLLTIGLSAVIAYTLLPVVKLLERGMPWRRRHPDLSRVAAILIIFVVGLGFVAGALLLVVPPMVREAGVFIEEFPRFFNTARLTVERWIAVYADRIPEEIKQDLEKELAGVGRILVQAVWQAIEKTVGIVSSSLSLIVGLATLPILVFYLMKDSGGINSAVCAPFPTAMRTHLLAMVDIMNRTLGAYIRGQITLALVVGTVVAVGLLLLGVPYAIFLGIVAGITELIPIIGPWIGGGIGVLVTLATEPQKALWVILLYLIIQLVENTILVPRIQGTALKLHPIAVIVVVIVAGQYFGLFGIILGPPLVAMGKDMLVYCVHEWNPPDEEESSLTEEEEIKDT
jgi:predicted PurR-regulated permease PerM